jgi:transposase-like protein
VGGGLMCPACKSQSLRTKKRKGIEWLAVLLTGKRKYVCVDCGRKFRAVDRRRDVRDSPAGETIRH